MRKAGGMILISPMKKLRPRAAKEGY